MLLEIYRILSRTYGPQNWWPMSRGFQPPEWEIEVGAVLTQNTAWPNVEKALENLKKQGVTTREAILQTSRKMLAKMIRPSGYYNQKSRKLKELAKADPSSHTRESLLSIWGIGKETADSILLYARNQPFFVIDAYTRRIFSRLGLIDSGLEYDKMRSYFEQNLPRDVALWKEFHALIVRHGKERCRPKPICRDCPLREMCRECSDSDTATSYTCPLHIPRVPIFLWPLQCIPIFPVFQLPL